MTKLTRQLGLVTLILLGLGGVTTSATASARTSTKSPLAAAVTASVTETEPTAVRPAYQHVVRVQTHRAQQLNS
ncbi:hypothetical protein [Levilactobacillus zymae]|uniref:hypothetical protein n=1 Tax=Levilactobacillus zymae TaxID=267363 RepID=UPI0028BA4C3A|nr:hypothetical protein [Levilactobacillus zymae]MDT6979409.1 hypothetical protein [Levilactobacillus zymae]